MIHTLLYWQFNVIEEVYISEVSCSKYCCKLIKGRPASRNSSMERVKSLNMCFISESAEGSLKMDSLLQNSSKAVPSSFNCRRGSTTGDPVLTLIIF